MSICKTHDNDQDYLKKILMFLHLEKVHYVMMIEFHFIFVTKDDVVIYLHKHMRIKQLLLRWWHLWKFYIM